MEKPGPELELSPRGDARGHEERDPQPDADEIEEAENQEAGGPGLQDRLLQGVRLRVHNSWRPSGVAKLK